MKALYFKQQLLTREIPDVLGRARYPQQEGIYFPDEKAFFFKTNVVTRNYAEAYGCCLNGAAMGEILARVQRGETIPNSEYVVYDIECSSGEIKRLLKAARQQQELRQTLTTGIETLLDERRPERKDVD